MYHRRGVLYGHRRCVRAGARHEGVEAEPPRGVVERISGTKAKDRREPVFGLGAEKSGKEVDTRMEVWHSIFSESSCVVEW